MRTSSIFAPLVAVALATPTLATWPFPPKPPRDITVAQVSEIFKPLGINATLFFDTHVEEKVDWIVSNPDPAFATNKLSGRYYSLAAFRAATFNYVNSILSEPVRLVRIHEPLVTGRWAVVELQSQRSDGGVPLGKNGVKFDNRYSWVVHFNNKNKIDIVRAYLDSALVRDLTETPIAK